MQAKELQTFLNQHKHIPKSVCRPADMHPLCFVGSLAHGWLRSEPRVSVKDQRRSGVHCCKAQTTLHSQRAWLLPQLMSAEPFLQQYIRTCHFGRELYLHMLLMVDISETVLRTFFWSMSFSYCRRTSLKTGFSVCC